MHSQNDRPLITWVRLVDGRLWHLGEVSDDSFPDWTLCDRRVHLTDAPDLLPELADNAPPTNGWVCDRCVRRLAEQAAAARQAWLQDPRRRPGDQLPAPDPDSPPEGEIRAKTIQPDVTPATEPTTEETEH